MLLVFIKYCLVDAKNCLIAYEYLRYCDTYGTIMSSIHDAIQWAYSLCWLAPFSTAQNEYAQMKFIHTQTNWRSIHKPAFIVDNLKTKSNSLYHEISCLFVCHGCTNHCAINGDGLSKINEPSQRYSSYMKLDTCRAWRFLNFIQAYTLEQQCRIRG